MVDRYETVVTKLGHEVDLAYVEQRDGTHAWRVVAEAPEDQYTDLNGDFRRLRVDPGNTAFYAGRQFDVIYDLSIAQGATQVFKHVSAEDFILLSLEVRIIAGKLKMTLFEDGSEGGTFNTSLAINATNKMSTAGPYVSDTAVTTGGTHSGGTARDMVYADATVQGSQTAAVAANEDDALGFPAGTYYVTIQNIGTGTVTGVYHKRWDERPIV